MLLEEVLRRFRVEARLSLDVAHNLQASASHVEMLAGKQEWLWREYTWPHMRIERVYPALAGQRFYDVGADFDLDRIERIEFKSSNVWFPLRVGIGAREYALHDSALDERADPARAWRPYEGEQVEIWPVPAANGDTATEDTCFKVYGVAKLAPFRDMQDRASLDGYLIALYAAAEHLASVGAKDAKLKLEMAQNYDRRLRAEGEKRGSFRLFADAEPRRRPRFVIERYRPPGA